MTRHLLVAALALPLIAAAPVLEPGTEADRAPGWLVRPDGDKIARFYPDRAQREETEGAVTLVCVAGLDTRLQDCKVASESPPDYGFGEAALKLSADMRMAPAIRQGLPVPSVVRVPLAFRMPEPEPPTSLPSFGPAASLALSGGLFVFAGILLAGLLATNRAIRRPR